MADLNYFRAIHGSLNMPNKTETLRRKVINRIGRDYKKALSVDEFYYWDKKVTDTSLSLNIYSYEFSTVVGHKQDFTCLINDTIQIGDIFYNPTDNQYWLIMDCAPIDRIHKRGVMYRCNGMLKWQDDNGQIWEYPYHDINSTQYNSGVEQGRNVDFGSSQHKITTTADENILSLTLDKRFFLGRNMKVPEVYKLSQSDTSSQNFDKGLISLTLLKDEYNADTDDKEQRLCDVVGRKSVSVTGVSNLTMKFSQPTIRAGGTKTITAVGAADTVWSIIDTEIADEITITATNPATCKLKVKAAIENIGKTFTVQCVSAELGETVTQTFTVVGGA